MVPSAGTLPRSGGDPAYPSSATPRRRWPSTWSAREARPPRRSQRGGPSSSRARPRDSRQYCSPRPSASCSPSRSRRCGARSRAEERARAAEQAAEASRREAEQRARRGRAGRPRGGADARRGSRPRLQRARHAGRRRPRGGPGRRSALGGASRSTRRLATRSYVKLIGDRLTNSGHPRRAARRARRVHLRARGRTPERGRGARTRGGARGRAGSVRAQGRGARRRTTDAELRERQEAQSETSSEFELARAIDQQDLRLPAFEGELSPRRGRERRADRAPRGEAGGARRVAPDPGPDPATERGADRLAACPRDGPRPRPDPERGARGAARREGRRARHEGRRAHGAARREGRRARHEGRRAHDAARREGRRAHHEAGGEAGRAGQHRGERAEQPDRARGSGLHQRARSRSWSGYASGSGLRPGGSAGESSSWRAPSKSGPDDRGARAHARRCTRAGRGAPSERGSRGTRRAGAGRNPICKKSRALEEAEQRAPRARC